MKQLILTFLMVSPLLLFSQTTSKDKETSNIEKFSSKSGTLIEKEFEDIGTIKGCKVEIGRFVDLISDQKTAGIRFEKEYTSSYSSSSDTKIAFLDIDEIDGLIKSFNLIKGKVLPNIPANYTEVNL